MVFLLELAPSLLLQDSLVPSPTPSRRPSILNTIPYFRIMLANPTPRSLLLTASTQGQFHATELYTNPPRP